jgi:hypothetical protein
MSATLVMSCIIFADWLLDDEARTAVQVHIAGSATLGEWCGVIRLPSRVIKRVMI